LSIKSKDLKVKKIEKINIILIDKQIKRYFVFGSNFLIELKRKNIEIKIINHRGYLMKAIKQCNKIFESLVSKILIFNISEKTPDKEVLCGKS
tara:strand:- start:76 stop:354 length:279 start_codon:yes stop_codon:yes gene_type:complete